jgi:hypothetical protein
METDFFVMEYPWQVVTRFLMGAAQYEAFNYDH